MNAYEAADFIEECQLEAAVGELTPERLSHLDSLLPGWRDIDAETMRTEAWMEELNIGYSSSVESAGSWLLEQQRRARDGKMSAATRARLDEKLPGWLTA